MYQINILFNPSNQLKWILFATVIKKTVKNVRFFQQLKKIAIYALCNYKSRVVLQDWVLFLRVPNGSGLSS